MSVKVVGKMRVYEVPASGAPIGSEQDALDLMGDTYGQEIDMIAVPTDRLHPDFLKLRTGMAGAFLQKMQNYGCRVAFVGNIAAEVAASKALKDFVYESNRHGQVLFVADDAALALRLARANGAVALSR